MSDILALLEDIRSMMESGESASVSMAFRVADAIASLKASAEAPPQASAQSEASPQSPPPFSQRGYSWGPAMRACGTEPADVLNADADGAAGDASRRSFEPAPQQESEEPGSKGLLGRIADLAGGRER